jgi:uncharacterized protein YkwD
MTGVRMPGRGAKPFFVLAVGLVLLASTPAPASAGALEDAVLAELNFARTHPADYVRELQVADGPGDARLRNASFRDEDPGTVQEAIDFLRRQASLQPLTPDDKLIASAGAHTAAQGPSGQVGHTDPDGTSFRDRVYRYGLWRVAGEDISYGYADAHDIVRQLIVDSGVPDRGHRVNIFDPTFQAAGVSCGYHAYYRFMCVIDFGGGPVAR